MPSSPGWSRRPSFRPWLLSAAALSAALLATSCDNAAGPHRSLDGTFAIAPAFTSSLAGIVPLREARITLRNPGSETIVVDTVIPIAPGDTAVDLSLVVPVVSAQQVFSLTVQLLSPSGGIAFLGGPIDVKPSVGIGQAAPIEITLQYVGVGSNAAGVRIITPDLVLFSGDTALVVAEAFDSAGQTIPATPIGFMSLAPQSAAFPDEAVGQVVAGTQRGTARLVATLLTGQADSISAAVQPVPTQIAIVSGGGQSVEVSQSLPSPVVLEVRGGDGLPIAGVTVRLSTPDNGAVVPDSAVTATDGRVTFVWTLGPTPGSQTVLAQLVEFPATQATVTATATAKPATAIAIVSGDAQTGTVNSLLTDSLVVLAADIDGNPAPAVSIRWTAILNDGVVSPANSTTDANGLAATAWTLGSLAGLNRVEASLPGSGSPSVIFTATGTAGPAAILELVSGDAQSDTVGATLPLPLVVRATDLFGNPAAGTIVAFATPDGGSLAPASAATDSLGLTQSVWTVGPAPGAQTATATSSGLGVSPVTFTATVSSPPRFNTWTGAAGDGLWTTAGNWSLNRAPTATDTVIIGIPAAVSLRTMTSVERVEITSTSATLRIGDVNPAALTVASGFGNAGTIVLTNDQLNASADLTVTGGTLVNTGTIAAQFGFGGAGARTVTATVDNQGTLSAESFNLTVQNTGRTLTTSAGTLATPNGNTVILNGGTVVFGSGTQLTGRGTFSLPVNTTLTLASDFTLAAADYRLDLAAGQGISVNGPGTLTVADTLVLQADTINAPVNFLGPIEARAGTSHINGTLSIAPSGLLRIGDVNPAALTVASGFGNAGTIVLTNDQLNASAALTVTSGTLVNTGTIAAQFGFGGAGARTVTGNLDNRGSVTLGFPLGVVGQLLSPAGTTGSVSGSGSILSAVGLDVDDMTFDNVPLVSTGGTITRFDNVTFQNMATDAIQLTVNHPGAAAPFTFNGAQFLTTPANGRYIRASDTNTGDGTPLTINMTNSTPADGSAYEDEQNGAVINWGAAAPAINVWTATSGTWSNGANWSLGRAPIAGDSVQLTQGLDYAVTLDVSPTIAKLTIGGTADVISLNVGDQTLTITDAGVDPGLDILPLGNVQVANGSISVNRLVNNGTVWISGVASLAASAISNFGAWQVAGGGLTVTHPTSYDFQQLTGTLDVASGAVLTLGANGALTYLGGGIGGSAAGTFGTIVFTPNVGLILGADLSYDSLTIELQDGFTTPLATERLTVGPDATLVLNSSAGASLNNIVENQGTMIALGEQNFPNDSLYNAAGAQLLLDGTAGSVALTVNRALDNAGDIRFTNTSGGWPARLIVYAEDLTNRPGATIVSELGDGTGLHSIDAQLVNDGTITLQHDFRVQAAQASRDHHVNNGTILVVGGTFELLQGGTDPTFTNDGILYATGGDILVTQDAATARVTSSNALLVGANRTLTFGGTSTSGALDVTAGLLTVDGSLTTPDSMFVRTGAVIQGSGTVDAAAVVGGDLSGDVLPGPAGASGTLTFVGDVPFAAGSVIYSELGGPAPGASDLVSVSGTATLDGTIDASVLLPGYTPAAGDTIPILTAGQIAGQPTFVLPTPPIGVLVSGYVAAGTVHIAFSADVQPASGEILFAGDSAFGLSTGVFSVASDGTALANVFPTASFPAQAVYPRWSPNRSRIAFGQTPGAGGTNQLVVVSADGAESAVVVTDTNVALPRWSPDLVGIHLAFTCYGYDAQFLDLEDVCVIDDVTGPVTSLNGQGDGGGKTFLTQEIVAQQMGTTARLRGPGAFAWNPQNPDQIAVVRDSSDATNGITSSRIYTATYSAGSWTVQPLSGNVMDVGTGALRVQSAWLDWSPDGQWLVFAASDPQGLQRVYRILADGSGLQALTSGLNPNTGGPADDDDPLISPTGGELLYSKLDYNQCAFDAWMVDAAGTMEEQVTDERLCDFPTAILGYDWSPTGTEFTFTGFQTPGTYDNLLVFKAPRAMRQTSYLSDRVLIGRAGSQANEVQDIQPSWRP